jgi:hypothetical protein
VRVAARRSDYATHRLPNLDVAGVMGGDVDPGTGDQKRGQCGHGKAVREITV